MTLHAIVLAGGRARRLDGLDKPLLRVDGVSLLERAVAAAREGGAMTVTVAGPARTELAHLPLVWVREDPPFSGPAAALTAAVETLPDGANAPEWTLVLAADLVDPGRATRILLDALPLLPHGTDGVCLADESRRPQWLTAVYRTRALRRRTASVPDGARDLSMRALLDDMALAVLSAPDAASFDIDTWEDLNTARAHADVREPHDRCEETT